MHLPSSSPSAAGANLTREGPEKTPSEALPFPLPSFRSESETSSCGNWMAELVDCIRECDLIFLAETQAVRCVQTCIFSLTRCDLDDFQGIRDTGSTWLPTWLSLALALCLIPATGLFAGLTIGLLSLDNVSLRVCIAVSVPGPSHFVSVQQTIDQNLDNYRGASTTFSDAEGWQQASRPSCPADSGACWRAAGERVCKENYSRQGN